MPAILNHYPRGKWTFLCPLLLFPVLTLATGLPVATDETIDPACRHTWDSLVTMVEIKDSLLNAQIDTMKDAKNLPVADEKLKLLNREERLHDALLNLRNLETSSTRYAVHLVSRKDVSETNTGLDINSGTIVFTVVDITTFVHETTHGGQFEGQSIAYKKDDGGPFGDDIQDEIEAFQTEFAYEPDSVSGLLSSSKPQVLNDITARWVRDLHNPGSNDYLYSPNGSARIAQLTISMMSSRHRILRAYKCYEDRKTRWKKGYTPMTDANLFYKEKLKPRMGA